MRPLLVAALVGLASYGAYALLVLPQTAAFLQQFSATADAEDLATPASERVLDRAADSGMMAAAGGVEAAPAPDRSTVRADVRDETYAVEGETERDVLESLRARGPRSHGDIFFGLTVTELEYRYYKVPEEGACRVEDVVVDLRVTITLPEWRAPSGASPRLRSDWARFAAALRGHENGHRDLAVTGAENVRAALEGLRTASCEVADGEARRIAERVRIETEAAHRDFDHRTGHGRTQGAVWPQP